MKGYHKVKVFELPVNESLGVVAEHDLPEGWKPFGVGEVHGLGRTRVIEVVCRKWERTEG